MVYYSGMSTSTKPAHRAPTFTGGGNAPTSKKPQNSAARRNFLVFAANMGWQLAVVVLVPVIGGAELDNHGGGRHFWVFIGLAVAAVASTLVMWRAVRLANRLPVPKLTAEQKRAIQKSYEEDE